MNSTPMLNQLLFNQMNNSSQNINFPQYKSTQNTQSIFPNLLKMIELNVIIFLKINIIQKMEVFLIGHVVIFLQIAMNVKVKMNAQNVMKVVIL